MKYKKKSQKVTDFCIGFFAMMVAAGIVKNGLMLLMMNTQQASMKIIFIGVALVFLYAMSIAYFFEKRKYIAIGIITQMIINIIFIGLTAYMMMRNNGVEVFAQ
jgi:divalent metal cation (Fe/Co/Zn/Cd) transporter